MLTYPHLYAPLRIGNKYFKNRIETAPMDQSGVFAYYTREALEQYSSFARGGAGVVTMGEAGVHTPTDHAHPNMPHLDDPNTLSSLIQCVDAIHKWGALASIELCHSGCRANPEFLPTDGYVIGPSAMAKNLYGAQVLEMDEAMMNLIADAFATAAHMAQFAGCDMVNLHGGHGWLLAQFLSNLNNHRKDQYGGSLENRMRFPLMVIDRIRKKCGPNLLIEFRLSADEEIPGGITPDEAVEIAKRLDGKVDIIHVTCATFHTTATSSRMFPTVFYPRGVNVENAAKIRMAVKASKVSVVGGIADPQMMDDIIRDQKADLVVVGRQMIADPNWPKKARFGKADQIIRCIRCEECISAGFIPHVPFDSGVLRCAVNPTFGREFETTQCPVPIDHSKKILIAGGGPAGMEAAITAARRGHKVILCEKADRLGYNLGYADQISFKQDIVEFLNALRANISVEKNIEVRLNTEVTEDYIKAEAPDVLFVACGAEPIIPPIPGTDQAFVHHITDLFHKNITTGEKVVIIGGGLAGCEEGLSLAWKGRDVTIVEMRGSLAPDAPYIHWKHLLEKLEESVHSFCNARVLSIESSGVKIVDEDGEEQLLPADDVLLATGMRATNQKYDSWVMLADEVEFIGDCKQSGKILSAMRTGYCAGATI